MRLSSEKVMVLCCCHTSAGLNELFLDGPVLAVDSSSLKSFHWSAGKHSKFQPNKVHFIMVLSPVHYVKFIGWPEGT